MASVMDNIRAMREKAQKSETKYYASKGGKNLNPGDFKEGKTIIRIAPSHSEINPLPFVPFRSTYLEVELEIDQMARYHMTKLITDKKLESKFGVEKIDDLTTEKFDDDKLKLQLKKLLGEAFTMKVNKRVFCSNLHAKEGSKDLVEEYIKFTLNKINSEIGDRDEAKKKAQPIFGWKSKDGKWNPGISPSTGYVCYGWDWNDSNKPFYKIELYAKMMERIEELYQKFDSEAEPLTVDPFSSADEGIGLQFNKVKNEKGKWDFVIDDALYNGKKQTYQEFVDGFKLEDAQLKQLGEVKSLDELFGRGSFKPADFKVQLSGLVLFDEKHGFNSFGEDEFLNIVETLSEQFSETEEETKKEEQKSGKDIEKVFKPKVEPKAESKGVDFKKALEKKTEKKVEPKVEQYASNVGETEGETEGETNEEESFREEQEAENPTTKAPQDLNAKLAALRKNLGKK